MAGIRGRYVPDRKSVVAEGESSPWPNVEVLLEKGHMLWQPWKWAWILKVLGKSVSLRVLEQRTKDLWKFEWGSEIIDLEKGYFLVRFYSRKDYMHVLENRPWVIMGHYLTIFKWRPNFRPSMEKVISKLAWVHFLEVPIEFFEKETLMAMGKATDKAVKIDSTTMGYKGLHLIFFECGEYDHRADSCSKNTPCGEKTQEQDTVAAGSRPGAPRNDASTTIEEKGPYDPWMLPDYSRQGRLVPNLLKIKGALHCEYRAYHSKEKRVPFTIEKHEMDIERLDLMRHGAKAEETKGIGQASGLP
ncbi:hypothetical protein M9H77_23598 [Catharanthus roseus]|uniref:Uncharacterized protein n=1 Tax=Catharanthus roseus TaxID=4058 RepID=A0ACC0AV97_CATRO|nr:hypothetical protein M9H77_23598 [Catharanthus roseus]